MEDTYKYIPDDEEVDLMMEDWLGGQRQNDTFVHKNTVDAMSRTLSKDESLSEYTFGDLSGLDPIEFAKEARHIAQTTVDMMSPEKMKVVIGGNTSYTDGASVTVASDFLDRKDLTPGEKADLLVGFAAHEASHLIHTDFDKLRKQNEKSKNANESFLRKTISNIIEDERIEMLVGDEMPGIADYFGKTKKHVYGTGYAEKKASGELPTETLPKFLNNLLAAVRYPAILERQDVIDNYDHLSRIRKVLTPFPKTTEDVYKTTDRIINVMKDLIEDELEDEMQNQPQQGQGQSPQQQGQNDSSGQSGQQNQQGQQGQTNPQGQSGQSEQNDSQGQQSTSGDGQGQQPQQPQPKPTEQEIEDAFNKAISSNQMQEQMKECESLANKSSSDGYDGKTCKAAQGSEGQKDYINDEAEVGKGAGSDDNVTYIRRRKGNERIYRDAYENVKKFVPAVRKSLACKAQESEYALNGMPSGKLNSNKFVSVRTGNENIFTRVGSVTTSGACVCILIDESGSMRGLEEKSAREAAILINEAIKGIPNLEAFVYGYTSGELNIYCERKTTDRWGIGSTKSQGGTPTGDAMRYSSERIRRMTRNNCLMFIITDGVPNNTSSVQTQDVLLRKKGFVPVGIGINSSARVTSLFKEAFCIDNLSELAPKLGKITKKYMDKLIVHTDSMA